MSHLLKLISVVFFLIFFAIVVAYLYKSKIMDDAQFESVQLNGYRQETCSPRLARGFIGLQINAPERVLFSYDTRLAIGEFAAIPICGVWAFTQETKPKKQPIMLHVREFGPSTDTALVISKPIGEPDDIRVKYPEPTASIPTPKQSKETVDIGFFNPNLARYIPQPENVSSIWEVWVSWGSYQSNIVKVRTVKDTRPEEELLRPVSTLEQTTQARTESGQFFITQARLEELEQQGIPIQALIKNMNTQLFPSQRIFLIDDSFIYLERGGYAADYSYHNLLLDKNQKELCSVQDSIAGQQLKCNDPNKQELFATMLKSIDKEDFGLTNHRVSLIYSSVTPVGE